MGGLNLLLPYSLSDNMFNDVILGKKIFLLFIIQRNHIKYVYIDMCVFPSPEFEASRGDVGLPR